MGFGSDMLTGLCGGAGEAALRYVARIPARSAESDEWPVWVHPQVLSALGDLGISRPWSHQVEAAEIALDAFAGSDVGKRSPAVVDAWRRAWNEFVPFLDMPADIRRVVYTTNAIESINYQLRKVSKTRGQFPGDEAAYKLLYLAICDIEVRTTTRGNNKEKKLLQRGSNTQHWKEALNQLAIIYPGRLPEAI